MDLPLVSADYSDVLSGWISVAEFRSECVRAADGLGVAGTAARVHALSRGTGRLRAVPDRRAGEPNSPAVAERLNRDLQTELNRLRNFALEEEALPALAETSRPEEILP